MLEFVKIKINNVASIEEQTYYFNSELNTLIGINKDTSDINKNLSDEDLLKLPLINLKSNGSGKTSIIEALHICLLGSCIKEKINTRQLIRNGEEKMRIELFCKNSHLGLSQIRIIREIYSNKNKTSKIEIFETKEGEEEKEILKGTTDNMDNYIINHYIGLSKEDIDTFFIIQKDKFKSFLLLPDQRKKDILSRFTGISNFSFIEQDLNKEIEEYNKKQLEKDEKIASEKGAKNSYEEILSDLPDKKQFEADKLDKIKNIKSIIVNQEDTIILKSNKQIELKNKIKIIKEILSIWYERKNKLINYCQNVNIENKINVLKSKETKIDKELEEIEEAISEANSIKKKEVISQNQLDIKIQKIKTLIKGVIECPKCHFEFSPIGDFSSKEELEQKKILQENEKSKLNNYIEDIEKDIIELKNILKEKNIKKENIFSEIKIQREKNKKIIKIEEIINTTILNFQNILKENEQCIKDIDFEISNIKNKISSYQNEIIEIERKQYNSITINIEKYKQKIKEIDINIRNIETEKIEIEKNIQLSKDSLIQYNLFKNYLYNKIIAEIEYIVNNYLQEFSDLSVIIKGNKKLADGKSVRDEIDCLITRNNKEISYFLLSSGEKAFVDIAFILTFQKILNITSNNGLNFLILDEITSNVDCANQEELLKAIFNLKKPILFITHIPTISDFRTTYLIKENNKTRIL